MIVASENLRREMIVRLAIACENALYRAARIPPLATVRERLTTVAQAQSDAALYSGCAFTWAKAEVAA